ncbi:hypothetical protein BH09VER1_BH09VER1_17490 [soil metagenome]
MFCSRISKSRRRAVALVVVLAMLVIVSLLIVSFMTVMRMDRAATQSYSQSIKAEELGQGALQLVTGELQNEMRKDAVPDLSYVDYPVYTNVSSTNLQPQRIGTNAVMANLVRISTNAPAFSGSVSSGVLRASTVSSSTPSQNGRIISTNRWSQPYLGNFPDNASVPYWILATRGGVTNGAGMVFGPTVANSVNNADPANLNYVIGRFAYAIYDEGALLNVTVAGYPNSATNVAETKGAAVWADLSQIPGVSNADALVQWRNAASYASYTNYVTNYAYTNGFTRVYPGDRTFVSRADLIRYAKDNGSVLGTNALPYLTTFSQDNNAPGWGPSFDATAGAPYNYKTAANTGTSINRFFPNVRVTTAFTRADGTAAKVGDPLVVRRFPLSRLNLISYNGTADTNSPIYKYFGLTRSSASDPWDYGAVDASSGIKTLKQVADEGREPNFFELLQSVILQGSLGKALGGGVLPLAGAAGNTDAKVTFQVLRIGANIIDQYDADNYPTTVSLSFSGNRYLFYGIEDIPYPNKILMKFVSNDPRIGVQPDWYSNMNSELFFEMWNPHQQTTARTDSGPTEFRIIVKPGQDAVYRVWTEKNDPTNPGVPLPGPQVSPEMVAYANFPTDTVVRFDVTPTADPSADPSVVPSSYREPRVVRDHGSNTTSILSFPTIGPKAVGFTLPGPAIASSVPLTGTGIWSLSNPYKDGVIAAANYQFWYWKLALQKVIFLYQYKDALNGWQTYATSGGMEDISGTGITGGTDAINFVQFNEPYAHRENTDGIPFIKSDPRTWRFGLLMGDIRSDTSPYPNHAITSRSTVPPAPPTVPAPPTPITGDTDMITAAGDKICAIGRLPTEWPKPARLDWLSQNQTYSGPTTGANDWKFPTYLDADTVSRPGDCYLSSTNQPMKAGDFQNRPIILNRPFRSVGELGYVFRDIPWKTLDLFSPSSGDGGLLDVFSVEDTATTAGRVNLNTRSPEVLRALLAGVRTREATASYASTNLSATSADAIAKAIVSYTATNSLVDAGGLAQVLSGVSLVTSANKLEHEAAMRALAGSTSARTWNLLIDLVAQVGKYPPGASSLDNFVVDGERRYWLHVAIDRFTGKVISKYIETPDE